VATAAEAAVVTAAAAVAADATGIKKSILSAPHISFPLSGFSVKKKSALNPGNAGVF